jgi:hypothetical protein
MRRRRIHVSALKQLPGRMRRRGGRRIHVSYEEEDTCVI